MQNMKRKGFTLMEMVLVMVLIAILATGVAIGFNQFINKGHETGITTDINGTFKNPIRMEAIEQGRLMDVEDLVAILTSDGFAAGAVADTDATTTWSNDVTAALDGAEGNTDADTFAIVKGSKRYQVFYDADVNIDGSASGVPGIIVRADHSSGNTTAVFQLNASNTDIETKIGELTDPTDFTTFVENN